MSVSDRLNKEKWPYTYMEMDEKGIVQYSNNPVIVKGQKLLSELPEKEGYAVTQQEGYKSWRIAVPLDMSMPLHCRRIPIRKK